LTPLALLLRLREAPVRQVQMPLAARVQFLLDDYAHFVADVEAFCARLEVLRDLRGAETITRWQTLARGGDFATPVQELLEQHYDPVYTKSMRRHFTQFDAAEPVELADAAPATLATAARALIDALPAPAAQA
jgi:tRNA 2-selenouridine synthase